MSSQAASVEHRTISPWVGFAFVMAGTVVGAVVLALANATLTAIESDLDLSASASELSWTLAFAALASFFVPAGQVADRIGKVRVFIIGAVALAVACALGGVAWSSTSFLGFRVFQGAAAAILFAPATGLVNSLFPDERRRGLAFAYFGLAAGLGLALGPIIGAAFLDSSWRFAFYTVAVAALIVAIATSLTMAKDPPSSRRGIDIGGGILLIVGLATFLIAIDQGKTWGWLDTETAPVLGGWTWPFGLSFTAALLLISLGSLVAMTLLERHRYRKGDAVVVDPVFFGFPSFSLGLISTCLVFASLLPLFVIFPMVSQILLGQGPLAMAFTVAALGIGNCAGALLSAPLGRRWGSRLVVIWFLIISGGLTLATVPLIGLDLDITEFVIAMFVVGTAIGVVYSRITELVLADVPKEGSAHASGIMFGSRSATGAIGSVLLTAVVTITVGHSTPLLARGIEGAQAIEASALASRVAAADPGMTSSGSAGQSISEVVSNEVVQAQLPSYVDGFRFSLGLAALVFFAAAAVTAAIPRSGSRRSEEARTA